MEDIEELDIHNAAEEREQDYEIALRPLSFEDFTGQKKILENLKVFVAAAKMRGEPLDHTLLYGPPGLGKTSLPMRWGLGSNLYLLLCSTNLWTWLDF